MTKQQWTPGAGIERMRREHPELVPDVSEGDLRRADEIIAAGAAADARRPRRAKIFLALPELHRLMGLGPNLRIVQVHVTRDPDAVHVTVEGEGVPPFELAGGDLAEQAAAGVVEAPTLRWPRPAGPATDGAAAAPRDYPAGARLADEAESAAIRAVLRGGMTVDEALEALQPAGLRERLERALQMREHNRIRDTVLDVLEEHGVSGTAVDTLTEMLSAAANRRAE